MGRFRVSGPWPSKDVAHYRTDFFRNYPVWVAGLEQAPGRVRNQKRTIGEFSLCWVNCQLFIVGPSWSQLHTPQHSFAPIRLRSLYDVLDFCVARCLHQLSLGWLLNPKLTGAPKLILQPHLETCTDIHPISWGHNARPKHLNSYNSLDGELQLHFQCAVSTPRTKKTGPTTAGLLQLL